MSGTGSTETDRTGVGPPRGSAQRRAARATPLNPATRAVLLFSVAACAACGLIYELVLLTLSASLIGGGITQTSLIVSGYIAALGAGALAVKPLTRHPAAGFVGVEITLGLLGGVSAAALYVTFAFAYTLAVPVLVAFTLVLGMLVGAEVPLLMTLLQTGRPMSAASVGKVLANLNAADYAGALLGGLVWPFVLLPWAGMIRGAALTGMINLLGAAVVALVLLRGHLNPALRAASAAALVLGAAALGLLLLRSADIETTSRQRLYADPIVAYARSDYQEVVLTRRGDDTRLYLDGDLQFSSRDEHRYTEALVYPALARDPGRVLILGGGDGLAAREVLKLPGVREVVLVELDAEVIELARTRLARLNQGALEDPRVTVVGADAMTWLREHDGDGFDAVIVDLPDPDTPALGRLYSQEFYTLVRGAAAPGALMVVQSGSPYSTPRAFWRTVATISSAGWSATPYHVLVPSFGDWGYTLATPGPQAPPVALPDSAPELRFLDEEVLRAATVFPRDRAPLTLDPSTLDHPRIVEDMRQGRTR